MQDLQHVFPRLRSYILYLLALYVLGWGFTSYKAVFAGLILGTALSLYNLWNLVRKFGSFSLLVKAGVAVCQRYKLFFQKNNPTYNNGMSTRFFNNSSLARPYIIRFNIFTRCICPSDSPLLKGSTQAAITPCKSFSI